MIDGGIGSAPTIVTVTWNTWETYTARLIDSFFHFVQPDQYAEWIMVNSASEDGGKIAKAMTQFPEGHREKFTLLNCDVNITDLPQYNRVIPVFPRTENIICISTDMRIFEDTIPFISDALKFYDLVGSPGPSLPREAADPKVGREWHWVPALLVKRGLEFDHTAHVQTHCFGVRKSAFVDVGGFWEPENGRFLDKGNLISGELMLSIKLRRAGYAIGYKYLPAHHYGNAAKTRESLDDFDKSRGWSVPFTKGRWV